MLSHHLFNYKQTKAHRNIWGTGAEALPASFRGYKQSKQDGGAGNTDTGGRSPEMRRGGLVSAPPLVLCYQHRSRGKGVVPPLSKLAGYHPTLIAHLWLQQVPSPAGLWEALLLPLVVVSTGTEFIGKNGIQTEPWGHLWIESESLLSTPHSLFFHLASLHGPGQSWGEVTTLRTQGPQPGPPGVRDQESEWRVNFTILQWAHSSISAWKISWQAIVHEVTKSLPRLSNWVYCSVYQRSISENQHAECKSTLEPDKNLTSQFSPVYNEDLWLSYWTGWKIKGNDAQRGFWHTRSVQ